MVIKIEKKIKGYVVVKFEDKVVLVVVFVVVFKVVKFEFKQVEVIQMYESVECFEQFIGFIFKIKLLLFEYVLYVIINDIVFNVGILYEQCCFFEIFINLKNMDYFQWIVVFICIIFVVFCKGGDVIFLVEEMKVVFDFCGGYFKFGGVYMFSIVVEIGVVIEQYMKNIGFIYDLEMDEFICKLIVEKCVVYEQVIVGVYFVCDFSDEKVVKFDINVNGFLFGVMLCVKCNMQVLVLMDGCQICLNCGYSKCG